MKSHFFLLPAVAFSLTAIRDSTEPLCSLQLRDNISATSIERTNDWTIISWTPNTLWPTADFFLALNGRLYGENGQLCSFSPYMRCADNTSTTTAENFAAEQDGFISLDGQKDFWFCPDLDGDAHHAEAAPLIYPPIGFLAQNDGPDYQICNKTTLYTNRCFADTDFVLDPRRVVLGGDASDQQQVTADARRTVYSIHHIVAVLIVAFLLL